MKDRLAYATAPRPPRTAQSFPHVPFECETDEFLRAYQDQEFARIAMEQDRIEHELELMGAYGDSR